MEKTINKNMYNKKANPWYEKCYLDSWNEVFWFN